MVDCLWDLLLVRQGAEPSMTCVLEVSSQYFQRVEGMDSDPALLKEWLYCTIQSYLIISDRVRF